MPKEELYVTPAQTKEQTPRAANCHHKHTFSNFIVGPENEFAYAATKSISDSSTPPIANPLFIYGGTGLGKTHLMQAVAHLITEENPNIVVEYISCEHFLNLYVKGIKENNPSKFRNRFRKADYLIIDDIHFIAGKIQLQEEFFNTFNKLYNEDRKILLTSDRKPSEIGGLEQRLISRFDSGLTVDIQPPGLETRLAILKKKQEEHLIKLNNDVLLFVAEKISSDVRKLEGAITRLLTYASLKGGEITLEIAEKILRPILEDIVINNITIESIQKKVADHFDLKVADLTSSKRPRNIAVPRMIAMYFARKMTDKSLPEIGRSFARNHATVLHAVKEIEKRNIKDENIRYTMSILERQLQNS
jgi:chromosomal replication initiator protein